MLATVFAPAKSALESHVTRRLKPSAPQPNLHAERSDVERGEPMAAHTDHAQAASVLAVPPVAAQDGSMTALEVRIAALELAVEALADRRPPATDRGVSVTVATRCRPRQNAGPRWTMADPRVRACEPGGRPPIPDCDPSGASRERMTRRRRRDRSNRCRPSTSTA
jgi:hypothetical protein